MLDLVPAERNALVVEAPINWNYTTWLKNRVSRSGRSLDLALLRTGGRAMLRMMNRPQHAS